MLTRTRYHYGTGNIVDARPYVFNGGTVTANFSNGQTLTLTWNNPVAQSFSPLRLENVAAVDQRNIYYEMSQTVVCRGPGSRTRDLRPDARRTGPVGHRRPASASRLTASSLTEQAGRVPACFFPP
jgi:hypothetical protein